MRDSLSATVYRRKFWASELITFLAEIGCEVQRGSSFFVDVDHALKLLCEQYYSVWQGLHTLPRQAPDRVRLTTYYRWGDREKWLDRRKYLFFDLSAPVTCAYLRFRLGTHNREKREILHPCSQPGWAG